MAGRRTVLLACPYLPPSGGGLEQYVAGLADDLEQNGEWRVVIVTSGRAGTPRMVRDETDGRTIYRLAAQLKFSNTPFSARWRRDLESIIRRENVTLVNAHAPVVGLADAGALAAGERPFVLTYHAGPMRKGLPHTDVPIWCYERMVRPVMLRRADYVICSSDWVRDCLGGQIAGKATTIPPAVDTDRFTPAGEPGQRLLFVGRLDRDARYKGISTFLAAIAALRARGTVASAQVVGEGDARSDYIRQARRLGIDKQVTFSGYLDGERLVQAYRAARAVVLPTKNDSIPLVLLEAMACGIPPISTGVGGIPGLLGRNERGLLVDPCDPAQLAGAMVRLLDEPELAGRLGRAARAEILSRYCRARQGESTRAVYDEATSARRGAGRSVVAIVTPYYPPKIGGLEKYAHQVASGVRDSSTLKPIVITSNHRRRRTAVDWEEDIPVIRLGHLFKLSNTPVGLLWVWRIPLLLRRYGVDVVNTHAPVPYIADVATATAGRRPVVATYHAGSMAKERGSLNGIIRLYEKYGLPTVLSRAAAVVAVSPTSLAAGREDAIMVSPGVDESVFVPPAQDGTSDSPTILYVGRIDRTSSWKGIGTLLEAMALLLAEQPDARLDLVGDGDAVEQYRRKARELGIHESVRLCGVLHGESLVQAYQRATLVVLPSLTDAESFGMSLVEGMACGKPVVGSRVGGIPRVVEEGVDGMLVPPGDAVALASALLALVRDPDRAACLGRNGRVKAVRDYGWKAGVASYLALFEAVAKGGAADA